MVGMGSIAMPCSVCVPFTEAAEATSILSSEKTVHLHRHSTPQPTAHTVTQNGKRDLRYAGIVNTAFHPNSEISPAATQFG